MSKTLEEMVQEIHTVVLGVPGTKDTGMAGKLDGLSNRMDGISRAVEANTSWRKALVWIVGVMIATAGVVVAFMAT